MSVPAGEARARAEAKLRHGAVQRSHPAATLAADECVALLADFDRLTVKADRNDKATTRQMERAVMAEARVADLTETLEQIIRSCAATLGPDGVHPALVVGNISTRARAALAGGSTAAPDEAKTPCSECGNTGDNFFGGEHGEAFALCGKCGHRWDPLAGSAVEPPEREQ